MTELFAIVAFIWLAVRWLEEKVELRQARIRRSNRARNLDTIISTVRQQIITMPDISRDHAKFHAHLDICQQCREHPLDLCPIGDGLLTGRLKSMFSVPDHPPRSSGTIPARPNRLPRPKWGDE